jgi:[ribosomal protein S5]-alanine N-acetyltransferase
MPSLCKSDLKAQYPTLYSDRLLLRQVQPCDVESLYQCLNDPSVTRYMAFRPETSSSKERLARYFADCNDALTSLHFTILLREDCQFAGLCSFQRWNEREGTASLGYMIVPQLWGSGIATEAARTLLEFGFSDLLMSVVYASCEGGNLASRRVLEKCGFEPTARSTRAFGRAGATGHPEHYMLEALNWRKSPLRHALLHK